MSTCELVRIGNQTEDGFLFSASCIIINRCGRTWTTATVTFPRFTHFSVEPSESKNDYVVTLYEKKKSSLVMSGSINIHLGKSLQFSVKYIALADDKNDKTNEKTKKVTNKKVKIKTKCFFFF